MPELPEVETVCRGLSKKLLSLNVLKVKTFDKTFDKIAAPRLNTAVL